MKHIELVQGINSSVLGFGCAPILGAIGKKVATDAIECAIDNEINHFDLARCYGYGEAERFVGTVIKGQRHKLVLTSKFGINANWKAKLFRPAKPILRLLIGKKQKTIDINEGIIQNSNTKLAHHLHSYAALNSKAMRKSLETSLKELRTDFIDYFLIHEPSEKLACLDELLLTANLLKKEGKIRAWGLAYMKDKEAIHQSYLDCFDILQSNMPTAEIEWSQIPDANKIQPNVIFSPFRNSRQQMSPPEILKSLISEYPKSVILCSMFNRKHIKENALLVNT